MKSHARVGNILEYTNSNALFIERLVLKGGTALNLTIFNLLRLSVDLDFDFHSYDDQETVLKEMIKVKELFQAYFDREGYTVSQNRVFRKLLFSCRFSQKPVTFFALPH